MRIISFAEQIRACIAASALYKLVTVRSISGEAANALMFASLRLYPFCRDIVVPWNYEDAVDDRDTIVRGSVTSLRVIAQSEFP